MLFLDFLEVHVDFFAVGAAIKAIHDNLKDSICVIFIQKNPGQEVGLGSWRSAEKARLYLSIERGKAKITDAKNWRDAAYNPNGRYRDFDIYSGTKITAKAGWYRGEISV